MIENFTHLDFLPHLNTIFTVHITEDRSINSTLIDVSTIGKEPTKAHRWAFSLLFHIDSKEHLEQKIYRLSHFQMADLEIFIVPLGPHDEGFRYEAIFT